jgi:type VI secretion system protein ImpL
MSISLQPDFTLHFTRWIAPLSGAFSTSSASGTAAHQTLFQIQPLPAPGVTEYTVDIDGQQLRYRNTPPQWSNFVWPNPQGTPGAKVTATTFDGRSIDVVNEPGNFGLEKLINAAQSKKNPDGSFDLSWTESGVTVAMKLRIISGGQSAPAVTNTDGEGETEGEKNGSGLYGVKLPPTIVGASPVPGATEEKITSAALSSAGAGAAGENE